jgi:endonuclease YncB( thermonuclease family)
MIGWRRRRDGFEWREYVRTTILVRRKNRRERVGQAAKAAVGGLRSAGERGAAAGAVGAEAVGRGAKVAGEHGVAAGVAGAHAVGRGAKAAGQYGIAAGAAGAHAFARGAKFAGERGLAMGIAAARATESGTRAGLPRLWAFLAVCGRAVMAGLAWLWQGARALVALIGEGLGPVLAALGRGLQPLFDWLRRPGIALPVAVAGGVALGAAWVRAASEGFDTYTLIALTIGVVIIALLLVARWSERMPRWLSWTGEFIGAGARGVANGGARLGAAVPHGAGVTVLRAAAVVAIAAVVVGGGWFVWRSLPGSAMVADLLPGTTTVEGQAVAVSGDTMRVAETTVRLEGIEAPALNQTCLSAREQRWRCGVSAKRALARLTGYETITCELSGESDAQGHAFARCHMGETDLAAELVRDGHVFAEAGFFSAYASLEDEAREAKSGIWRGEAERPSEYRAQKWEEAKRDAPDGCPIKGNVNRGRRVYVLPWARGYERVRISSGRGERWFCSEEEARAAGFEPSGRS